MLEGALAGWHSLFGAGDPSKVTPECGDWQLQTLRCVTMHTQHVCLKWCAVDAIGIKYTLCYIRRTAFASAEHPTGLPFRVQ